MKWHTEVARDNFWYADVGEFRLEITHHTHWDVPTYTWGLLAETWADYPPPRIVFEDGRADTFEDAAEDVCAALESFLIEHLQALEEFERG